ncbi:unnamed protein product [Linum trigynum]|uniref:Uncharacterized protein n=1 Tax=Linum trigynum TaxID=586398 RepID=A0AAV2CER9_9ROSI
MTVHDRLLLHTTMQFQSWFLPPASQRKHPSYQPICLDNPMKPPARQSKIVLLIRDQLVIEGTRTYALPRPCSKRIEIGDERGVILPPEDDAAATVKTLKSSAPELI